MLQRVTWVIIVISFAVCTEVATELWLSHFSFNSLFSFLLVHSTTNSVAIPDGCSPTNYSGTQINFWGCAPNLNPGKWAQDISSGGAQNGAVPYGTSYPNQLGALTNKMISVGRKIFRYTDHVTEIIVIACI